MLLIVLVALGLVLGALPSLPAAAATRAPVGSFCDNSWSGLGPHNPVKQVRAGYLSAPGFRTVKVATDGDVDWSLDPFGNLSWRVWLDTLGWAGPLIDSYDRTGNRGDLELALAYARDYVTDKPINAFTPDEPLMQQASRRLLFFTCLYERAPADWLGSAMTDTVAFLAANWAGAYNHGLDQDHAIFLAGCALERPSWRHFARGRLAKTLAVSIDSQGATNEQSTGYALYTYRRWLRVAKSFAACREEPLATLAGKLAATERFIAHATRPDGALVPIGDTDPGTRGITNLKGLPLSGIWTINGYAFGRSSWKDARNPSHYSLRFGPPRQIHGGGDHGSVALYANGSPVVTEPGSIRYGFARSPWFQRAPEAHNILRIGDGRCTLTRTAELVSQRRTAARDRYVVSSPDCNGMIATRRVVYRRAAGALRVDDTTNRARASKDYEQLWHLVPGTTFTRTWVSPYKTLVKVRMPNKSRAIFTIRSPKRADAKRVRFKVTVVTGRYVPYQGWVAGGVGKPVAAPVIVVSQRGVAANLRTVITTR